MIIEYSEEKHKNNELVYRTILLDKTAHMVTPPPVDHIVTWFIFSSSQIFILIGKHLLSES